MELVSTPVVKHSQAIAMHIIPLQTAFLFFLVDKCGDELPCIHEAFQSIQDEPFVSVFTGCVLLSGHDCDRIYYNVIRRVSNNTEMSILLVLRCLTNL